MLKLAEGSRLLFMGDSVTDMGRARPVAEGLFNPHGTGYPNVVHGLLAALYPERHIHVINMGCSGNTARDLLARWQTDCLDLKPDWVSVMIGINDVWRQFDSPHMPASHVLPAEYEAALTEMIRRTKPVVKGMVLMTPYYIEDNPADAMRARMDEYGAICKKLAKKHKLIFVDTQAAFNEVLKHYHSSYFAWDRVHPNIPGANVLARAFLNGIGFEWK